jgi:hypothetical protein
MTQADAEFLISSILSRYAADEGVSIKDIKVKTERADTVFEIPGSISYMCEITYKAK